MPIYVEDCVPLVATLPPKHMEALMEMCRTVNDSAVNPAMAMQLLRTYVQPLVPMEHRLLFAIGGQATWDRVHVLYPELAFASGGTDNYLLAAATLVNIVYRHSTRPPRELQSQQFIEVAAFTNVCGVLGVASASPTVVIGEAEVRLHNFCRYCWLPARSHGVCGHHVSHVGDVPHGVVPLCAAATFKQVQRLRPQLEKAASSLATAETLAFHESGFHEPVLVPLNGLGPWLSQRRPRLAVAIGDCTSTRDLLVFLYGEHASEIADALGTPVHLITPVTTRAEAWLLAWEQRPGRGGARVRTKPSGANS